MIRYEQLLDQDVRLALEEGSLHFEEGSAVHRALRKITRRLDELGIPYAIAGGMALFLHGFRRFTEDVDLIVTREALQRIHEELEGRGYLPPFTGSKNLRDAELGVRIEFLVSGDYPGDGKPKSVTFPEPSDASTVVDDLRLLNLDKLIELKLASGLTNPLRLKDVADVQELIRILKLPEDFAQRLDPLVREKFRELHRLLASHPEQPE